MRHFLDFEKPIAELEGQIEELRRTTDAGGIDVAEEVGRLQDKAEKHTYAARELSGAERQEWWDHAVATWPTYASYAEKTDREIPVFLLERTD